MKTELLTEIRGDRQFVSTLHNYGDVVTAHCERLGIDKVGIVFYPADFATEGSGSNTPPAMSVGLHTITYHDTGLESKPLPALSINLARSEHWSREALEAVVAHEFGHLVSGDCDHWTRKGRIKQWLYRASSSVAWIVGYSFHWRKEYRADLYAAELVGPEAMEALLDEVIVFDVRSSLSHPSVAKRRRNVERFFARRQAALRPLGA